MACAQSLKDGAAKSDALSMWGPEQDGVRTGLTARQSEFSLGKPIVLRLEMENVGNRVIHYDPTQVAINSSMSIEGNDGVKVPSIAPHVQTGGDSQALNPGERTVLFETLDIADQYLITSAGSYKVQFKGFGKGFADTAIPPSNAITIRVADGALRPSRQIARSLFDAAQPAGWRVGIDKDGSVVPLGRSAANGTSLALIRDARPKQHSLLVLIWVTEDRLPVAPSEQDGQRSGTATALGECSFGEVYFWSGTATPEELSTVRQLIVTALKIAER